SPDLKLPEKMHPASGKVQQLILRRIKEKKPTWTSGMADLVKRVIEETSEERGLEMPDIFYKLFQEAKPTKEVIISLELAHLLPRYWQFYPAVLAVFVLPVNICISNPL
ncbi:hypothetical protein BaRGS_00017594, partial [Batillaria attramentaria]